MPHIDQTDQLLAFFLGTDPKLWVRFVPRIAVKATYYCDADVRDSGRFHRFLLVIASRRVVLEAGPISSGHGLIFNARSIAHKIAPDTPDLDCVGANWSGLNDPFMRKAREIAEVCSHKFAPSPFDIGPRPGQA
ncbi:hypothetical protein [Ramlibacter sp. Leaf400]|uniref:hypothetical protein n=1 Tax=Ramlibacter sp. Leaf400 TaxID=1736365 RepID=UPI0012E3F1CC|nr:hypothetical protein [Ramlibacter sp. Leaf400]